jgi:hypothetical protein
MPGELDTAGTNHEIATPHINKYAINERPNGLYGFQLFESSDKAFLVYITSGGQMKFVGLTDSSMNYTIDVTSFIRDEQYPRFLIVKDSLYFFKPKGKTITLAKITADFRLANAQVFQLKLDREGSDFYFMWNAGYANFNVTFPNVLMPYGKSFKRNYIDTTAYISYNLLTDHYNKIIKYPECYEHCNINGYQSAVLVKDQSIYCVFKKHDEVFQFDLEGNLIANSVMLHDCKLEEFDKGKKDNLAYVRKYQLLGEYNCQILINDKKDLMVIKKLKSEELSDQSGYEVFIFNANLEQCASVNLNRTLYPFTTFTYREGFLLFQEKLAAAFYYDSKNIN